MSYLSPTGSFVVGRVWTFACFWKTKLDTKATDISEENLSTGIGETTFTSNPDQLVGGDIGTPTENSSPDIPDLQALCRTPSHADTHEEDGGVELRAGLSANSFDLFHPRSSVFCDYISIERIRHRDETSFEDQHSIHFHIVSIGIFGNQ